MYGLVPCRYRKKSAKKLPYITEPIVYEILTWVPAQDLLRYKTVCKEWRSWIDDPLFIELHKSRARRSIIGTTNWPKCNRLQLSDGGDVFLLSKRCGLILGSSSCGMLCVQTCLNEYFIFNPATGKSLRLPPLMFNTHAMEMRVYHNPQSRQFNIVAICKYPAPYFKVYHTYYWAYFTVGIDSKWRYKEYAIETDPAITWSAFVLCESAPFCLLQYAQSPRKAMTTVMVDPCTGKYRIKGVPFYVEDSVNISIIAYEWDGKFSISSIMGGSEIQAWVLEDHDQTIKWRNERVIVPKKVKLGFNGLHSICFVQQGKMWLRSMSKDLFSLDLLTNKVEKISSNAMRIYDFEPYQSTLESF